MKFIIKKYLEIGGIHKNEKYIYHIRKKVSKTEE